MSFIPIITALASIAPTITAALKIGNGTIFKKAVDTLAAFVGAKGLSPEEINLRLNKIDQETFLKLKELDQQFQLTVAQHAHELSLLEAQVNLVMAETTKEDAKSEDKFQSRWRPFIAWNCGFAFSYHFLILPIIISILAFTIFFNVAPATVDLVIERLPKLDIYSILGVLGYLLGYGGYRTYEKKQGIKK